LEGQPTRKKARRQPPSDVAARNQTQWPDDLQPADVRASGGVILQIVRCAQSTLCGVQRSLRTSHRGDPCITAQVFHGVTCASPPRRRVASRTGGASYPTHHDDAAARRVRRMSSTAPQCLAGRCNLGSKLSATLAAGGKKSKVVERQSPPPGLAPLLSGLLRPYWAAQTGGS
jgi:hypothetical protein